MIKKLLEEREILRKDYIALAEEKKKMVIPANYDMRRAYLLLTIFPFILVVCGLNFLIRVFEAAVDLHRTIGGRS